jgi:phenylalanyl-tRNA synthetase beta chain
LHVFDLAKVDGDLTMRFARNGEKVDALDGETYTLDDGMTVIADANQVQGIGGVMGGAVSGCSEETTDVFLEVALFDPIRTAMTGRKLGIQSDARFRFERTVDPQSAEWGAEVAARMILDLCGGEVSNPTVAGSMPDWQRQASLRVSRLESFGGAAVSEDGTISILDRLGFTPAASGGVVAVEIPSWRPDVEGEHCLVEEVLRVHGYDEIPAVPMRHAGALPQPALNGGQRRAALAKRVLAGRGMMEAVSWSFMGRDEAALFGDLPDSLSLANPISADLDVMRPSILGNLLSAGTRNADRGYPDVALFEVGPAWRDDSPDGQDLIVAGLRQGNCGSRHWDQAARGVDAYDAKADAQAVLAIAGAPVDKLQVTTDAPGYYHPGRSGVLRLGPNVLAYFGELHPAVLRRLGSGAATVGFEVFLDHVPTPKAKAGRTRPALNASPFQPVARDFAFVVDTDIAADSVVRAAQGADKGMITQVGVFDLFEGKSLGEGRKSIAISVTLQPTDRTLTDADIEAVSAKIVANVEKRTGGTLRG